MPETWLEQAQLAPLVPETSVSTNSTIRANLERFYKKQNILSIDRFPPIFERIKIIFTLEQIFLLRRAFRRYAVAPFLRLRSGTLRAAPIPARHQFKKKIFAYLRKKIFVSHEIQREFFLTENFVRWLNLSKPPSAIEARVTKRIFLLKQKNFISNRRTRRTLVVKKLIFH